MMKMNLFVSFIFKLAHNSRVTMFFSTFQTIVTPCRSWAIPTCWPRPVTTSNFRITTPTSPPNWTTNVWLASCHRCLAEIPTTMVRRQPENGNRQQSRTTWTSSISKRSTVTTKTMRVDVWEPAPARTVQRVRIAFVLSMVVFRVDWNWKFFFCLSCMSPCVSVRIFLFPIFCHLVLYRFFSFISIKNVCHSL